LLSDIFAETPIMFELRSYSRKELALLYFPDNTPKAASQNFRRLLKEKPVGSALLQLLSYRKYLTEAEVKRITTILGEP